MWNVFKVNNKDTKKNDKNDKLIKSGLLSYSKVHVSLGGFLNGRGDIPMCSPNIIFNCPSISP